MTRKLAAVLFGLSAMGTALSMFAAPGPGERGPKQSFEATSTERMNFLPGGTISLNSSYGYLTVEGWDEPEVEITVTKSTNGFYQTERKEKADFVRAVQAPSRRVFLRMGRGSITIKNGPPSGPFWKN